MGFVWVSSLLGLERFSAATEPEGQVYLGTVRAGLCEGVLSKVKSLCSQRTRATLTHNHADLPKGPGWRWWRAVVGPCKCIMSWYRGSSEAL